MRVGNAKNAARPGAKSAHHQFAIIGLNQKNLGDCRVRKMDAAHRRQLAGDVDGMIQREHNNFGGVEVTA